jgi:hypothetical protein
MSLKQFTIDLFRRALRRLQRPSMYERLLELSRQNRDQAALLNAQAIEESERRRQAEVDYAERVAELVEARQMAGAGPWRVPGAVLRQTDQLISSAMERLKSGGGDLPLREASPDITAGAYGDIELALQNVEWRREVNISWLEFSRWGIQQIILISRLHYIKNPIIRRLIDIAALYVFARGVEVSSPDETANGVLQEFFEANKKTLGQIALVDLERRKYYDGNIFFAFFADTVNTGAVKVRTIDATEIADIVCDPDDSDTPWYYKRCWTRRTFDPMTGSTTTESTEAWYPALGYDPPAKPTTIGALPVMWNAPIHHRKCGAISKWHFGCPIIYPALDWAKASKKFLEACATVKQALAQIAMTLTTKGGMQAIEGAKQQLSTTVGPASALWDQNPTAVNASIFASGPGTKIEAFKTSGAGGNPEEVRRYLLMCCMVVGVPETFLADVSTGNLATATTLDRPTELCFLEKQEAWREDLVLIANWVLSVSASAASGKLREARGSKPVVIREAARKRLPDGSWRYVEAPTGGDEIEVKCTFPSIREGDIPQLVSATVQAMTLGNAQGNIVGIDEKAGVRKLYEQLGIDNGDELTEAQYPEDEYDPNRENQKEAAMERAQSIAAATKPEPGAKPKPKTVEEALARVHRATEAYAEHVSA